MFFPWFIHPDRDDQWYRDTLAKMNGDTSRMQQEYPATPDEMFRASGTKVFNRGNVEECWQEAEILDTAWAWPGWEVYAGPEEGRRYVIGADPADAGGDGCSADVIDTMTGDQVCHLLSYDWDANEFADQLAVLGEIYNDALIIVERENHGHTVNNRLATWHNYQNLYEHHDGKLGHPTNKATRPLTIDGLKQAFFERRIKLHSRATYSETVAFAWIKGKAQAPEGMHDDCVMSLGKAIVGLDYVAGSNYVPPEPKWVDVY